MIDSFKIVTHQYSSEKVCKATLKAYEKYVIQSSCVANTSRLETLSQQMPGKRLRL